VQAFASDLAPLAPRTKRTMTGIFGIVVLTAAIGWTSLNPSNDRNWIAEQRLLPRARVAGDIVRVRNVRNFRWARGKEPDAAWENRSYRLSRIRTVSYVLTPFSTDWRGPAHAFVSFAFDDGEHIAISIEARREVGEEYSIARGLLKQFELMYVIGDERDVIEHRVQNGDDVYVYPMRASQQQVRELFLEMLERANRLHDQPEFYGSLLNNCTTNLLAHVNRLAARRIRYGRKIFLPGYSDQVAYERGLIDTALPLDSARARFRVNERAARSAGAADYSLRIRD
jgi:hypothetical protein